MMIYLIKIILFVLVNLGGYFSNRLLMDITKKLGFFPSLPPGELTQEFTYYLITVGNMVWIASALISIGYFFAHNRELKTWLILAPLYAPTLYGLSVILYYDFVVTS